MSQAASSRRTVVVLLALGLLIAPAAGGQEADDEEPGPALEWSPGVSDVPVVDLGGAYVFDPEESDPMVEAWRDRTVRYRVTQTPQRIVLEFRPEDADPNVRTYRWDGGVTEFNRGTAEVRERARWVEGGRVLEIEGRWWLPDDHEDLRSYTLRYRLDGPRSLVFTQIDAHGRTEWRFERS